MKAKLRDFFFNLKYANTFKNENVALIFVIVILYVNVIAPKRHLSMPMETIC